MVTNDVVVVGIGVNSEVKTDVSGEIVEVSLEVLPKSQVDVASNESAEWNREIRGGHCEHERKELPGDQQQRVHIDLVDVWEGDLDAEFEAQAHQRERSHRVYDLREHQPDFVAREEEQEDKRVEAQERNSH